MRAWLAAAAMAVAVPAQAGERVLTVCDDVAEPLTLSPLEEFSQKNHTIVQQMFDGLVRLDADGRIEPALAVSWERRDPMTVRFRLRPGVRFHDGEPFDAEAVRYTLQRYLDPAGGFPAGAFVSPIREAVVVDPMTVDVVTHFPDGLLLHRLGGFVVMVPPRYALEKGTAALRSAPVGTGSFRFERWERGKEIVLAASTGSWRPPTGLSAVRFVFLPADRQLDALEKGEVDLVTEVPGTATLRFAKNPRTSVVKRPTFYTVAGTFNTSRPPFSDARVRRAVNLAIDRQDLIRYDLLGNGAALATLSMPGELGHDPKLKPYAHDPEQARRLLKEAGVAAGTRIKTLVLAQSERAAGIIARQLEKVGLVLDVRVGTEAEMFTLFREESWDLGIGGMPNPMGHAAFIPSIMLYSRSPYSLMRDPDFDGRLEAAVSAIDPVYHEKMTRELDRHIYDQALSVFTYQRIRTYGVSRDIRFDPWVTGMPYFAGTTHAH